MREITFEGKTYRFPADATDAEITQALSQYGTPAAPPARPTFLQRLAAPETAALPFALRQAPMLAGGLPGQTALGGLGELAAQAAEQKLAGRPLEPDWTQVALATGTPAGVRGLLKLGQAGWQGVKTLPGLSGYFQRKATEEAAELAGRLRPPVAARDLFEAARTFAKTTTLPVPATATKLQHLADEVRQAPVSGEQKLVLEYIKSIWDDITAGGLTLEKFKQIKGDLRANRRVSEVRAIAEALDQDMAAALKQGLPGTAAYQAAKDAYKRGLAADTVQEIIETATRETADGLKWLEGPALRRAFLRQREHLERQLPAADYASVKAFMDRAATLPRLELASVRPLLSVLSGIGGGYAGGVGGAIAGPLAVHLTQGLTQAGPLPGVWTRPAVGLGVLAREALRPQEPQR